MLIGVQLRNICHLVTNSEHNTHGIQIHYSRYCKDIVRSFEGISENLVFIKMDSKIGNMLPVALDIKGSNLIQKKDFNYAINQENILENSPVSDVSNTGGIDKCINA